MLPYELTLEAEADLKDIVRYTIRQWGEKQARRYIGLLEAEFRNIAANKTISRPFSAKYPQVRVTKCEHHYIFYLFPEGKSRRPVILAVLHERMDLVNRLKSRLSE
ncbi:MAG: type II toxin-antitoxin system RelE/ParE family toxin [Xenococcaceae cyanobacterium]